MINESSEHFDEGELNLLNKGLKFTPKPVKLKTIETIVDIESMLKFKLPSIQNDIRKTSFDVIQRSKRKCKKSNESAKKQLETIKKLKEKDVVYVKADKGNQVVILDKSDYEERVNQLIDECGYKKIKK